MIPGQGGGGEVRVANPGTGKVALLLEVEQAIRQAETLDALGHIMVNDTRRLVPAFRIALFRPRRGKKVKLMAVSDLAETPRTTPFALFACALVQSAAGQKTVLTPLSMAGAGAETAAEWADLAPPEAIQVRLPGIDGKALGYLLLFRDRPWNKAEQHLLTHLAGVYGHGMQARGAARGRFPGLSVSRTAWALMLVAGLAGSLPVRMSALAPAAIVPKDPFVVTSPMDGVVRRIHVCTNDRVLPGQVVAQLEDTDARNRVALAQKAVALASVVLDKAERSLFQTPPDRGKVARFKAALKLRKAELDYAREMLAKTRLCAEMAGVAVVTNPLEWKGKPVSVGQRILMIADPGQVEFKVMLPTRDALTLTPGARIRVFLDTDPLSPLDGHVIRWDYEPSLTPAGVLAYHVRAALDADGSGPDKTAVPRIGLRGVAKVYGGKVSLFFYLFRRPVTALRQWTGI